MQNTQRTQIQQGNKNLIKKKNGLKTITDTSPKKIYISKKIYIWPKRIWKDALHHISGKCKLKQNSIKYLWEWPKSRPLTTPNPDDDGEQKTLLFIVDAMHDAMQR